ncbi:MAG: M23 family metallopeptidase [Rikenellaceae bacterium]
MKKFIAVLKHIINNFNKKHQLSFNNPHDGELLWQIFISPMNILMFLLTVIIINFGMALVIITYTPILDMIPGYPGNKSRELLINNVIKLDSLENELELWDKYRENIIRIMDGLAPLSVTVSNNADSVEVMNKDITKRSEADSLFRKANITSKTTHEPALKRDPNSLNLFLPVKGVVTKKYNIKDGFRGVEFTTTAMEPVLSVDGGNIILSTWSPEEGYILQIQHGNGVVSTYKKLSKVLKKIGDSVKGGEVIGYVGDESLKNATKTNNTLVVEFWNNGNSIDPENYLIF